MCLLKSHSDICRPWSSPEPGLKMTALSREEWGLGRNQRAFREFNGVAWFKPGSFQFWKPALFPLHHCSPGFVNSPWGVTDRHLHRPEFLINRPENALAGGGEQRTPAPPRSAKCSLPCETCPGEIIQPSRKALSGRPQLTGLGQRLHSDKNGRYLTSSQYVQEQPVSSAVCGVPSPQ